MSDKTQPLYHLTNISNCIKILREKQLRPRNLLHKDFNQEQVMDFSPKQLLANFDPGDFVHFNFCPRSVMLFKAKQYNHVGEISFYGQQDAVHIRLPSLSCICVEMDVSPIVCSDVMGNTINVRNTKLMSDMDCSWFNERKLIALENRNDCEEFVMQHLDEFSLKKEYAWQPNEIRAKSAELLIAPLVKLSWCKGYEIGVYNCCTKKRLEEELRDKNINVEGRIAIHPEWYF